MSSDPVSPAPSETSTITETPVATDYTPNYVTGLNATRRWDQEVITVGVESPAVASDESSPDHTALVQQAIDLWEHKVGGEVQFHIVAAAPDSSADVTVGWVAPETLPGESIGRTAVQFRTGDQILISAQVAVAESLPDSFQVQVIAHELGHALGIDGHSADPTDLMYTNSHLPAVVTESDQNTILWAYQVGPTRSLTRRAAPEIESAEVVCGLQR